MDVAGRFAAKLFAMAGIDVVRPAREQTGVLDRYLDGHKQFADPAAAPALAGDADLVFTTFDRGQVVGPGVALPALPERVVEITTSSYGTTGPYAAWRGGPLADWAAGGYLAITGRPDREPLAGPEHLCGYVAGYTAAIAGEAALFARRVTGRGARVDVSAMEAMLSVHQSTFSRLAAGVVRTRSGRYTEVYPLVVRPCSDGYVSLGVVTDLEFDRLAIAIGRPELAADDRFRDAGARWEHRDALDAILAEFLDVRTVDVVVETLLDHGVAAAGVAGARDVLQNAQLDHRHFWDPSVAAVPGAVAPGNPVRTRRSWGAEATERDPAPWATPEALPLAGITVLDLTAFWAGPSATRALADLGARVVWVERPGSRRDLAADATELEVVMHHFHLKMNRNKESVVLDLARDDGRDAARRLVAAVDVVVENFRPGVMASFGLDAATLCAEHPGLVYVSLSGFGATGPWADRRSYGPTIEAASSIEGRTGYAGDEPMRLGHTLPDGVGGLVGALAAIRGVRERADTGHGGWFDLSQLETYVALSGEELLAASETDASLRRVGNRSRSGAYQFVAPCAGDDQWVAVRLSDTDDTEALARAIDAPEVITAHAGDDHDTIDQAIGAFTRDRGAREVAELLQAVGVEAFPVLTPPELLTDPHLDARGFFRNVPVDDGTAARTARLPGSPFHGLPVAVRPAPRFGEHTASVLAGLDQVTR